MLTIDSARTDEIVRFSLSRDSLAHAYARLTFTNNAEQQDIFYRSGHAVATSPRKSCCEWPKRVVF
jgi:hypothetical protein